MLRMNYNVKLAMLRMSFFFQLVCKKQTAYGYQHIHIINLTITNKTELRYSAVFYLSRDENTSLK